MSINLLINVPIEPASRLPRLVTSSLKFHMYVNTVSTSVNYMIVHNYIP